MAQTGPIRLDLRLDLSDEARAALSSYDAVIAAGGELAEAAMTLLDFVPGEASPVVITRDRLAPLQAAVDNYTGAAEVAAQAAAAAQDA